MSERKPRPLWPLLTAALIGLPSVVALMFSLNSGVMQARTAGAQELQRRKSVLLPVLPKKWSLAHSLHPGGPEGRKAISTEVSLNQDGEYKKVRFQARKPEAATKIVSQLSVEEREEYLRLFGAALESFSFEPEMEGWFDTDAVTLTLKSGRQSMEIVINEIRGETNLEFRSRLAKLLPLTSRTETIDKHVQPDPTRRFVRMAGAWRLHVSLEVGTRRLYKVEVESRPTSEGGKATASPRQLLVREFKPGSAMLISGNSADLEEDLQKKFLERALSMLRGFTFQEEEGAAEGEIAVSLTLVSNCLTGGETTRKLTVKHSGLTAAQFEKSVAADFIHVVNEQIPEKNRIQWE